ncbi:apolipoprotein C-IV isoform X2 [Xyrichtys novacula]|uniref:Apolipoprotein C-IV isoform X2 n=1 Tax=Xyrichtys novacula TaxID=13765 RepID=A0AAV1FNP2_XYRNO|nr:apolipoprotein C-IV isoform X2 [Xyrichtys novacula]
MQMKELVFTLILLMQAWDPLWAQTTAAPAQPDPPGLLQRLTEGAREVRAKVQNFGELVRGFADAYYEDHIEPGYGKYFEWASGVRDSAWERIRTTADKFSLFKGKTPTDQPDVN